MFDHKHYVPILKTKAGEMWALRELKAPLRKRMVPLLEFHQYQPKKDEPPKPMADHVNNVCKSINKSWGSINPFFLDTEWINNQYGTATALKAALDQCRFLNLNAIPVVKIDYDEAALDVVKAATSKDNRGYMLRIDFEDASAHPAIHGVVDYLGLQKGDAHLLLDYRKHPMNLVEDIQKLPTLTQWLTFTSASAAFPKTISTLPSKLWVDMPRHDWNAWNESVTGGGLSRKPTFGDYATRCAGPPAGGGYPIVHLRYTKEKIWLVYKDGTLQSGEARKMPSICRKLIARPEYDGLEFSQGDEEIYQKAKQEEKTGGAQQWLQWCLNHHLTFTITQIQGYTGI